MSRMRLLILLETSTLGGIELQALLTTKHLDRAKYEVHIMVTDIDWVLGPQFAEHAEKYTSLDMVEGFWDVVSTPTERRLEMVTAYIEDNEIDVVHMFNGIQYIFAIPEEIPLVMHLGGDYSRRAYFDKVHLPGNRRKNVKDFLNEKKNLILTSDMPQNTDHFKLNVTHIPNYLEIKSLPDIEKEDFTVIWVGRDSPEKHPEMVLKIARKMPDYQFTMVIATLGKTSLKQIPKNVTVLKNITDRDDLMELYKEHDIYLLTSDTEGFPLTLPESWSQGCMSVVSQVGNINKETVPHGYLCNPEGIKSYIGAIESWTSKDETKKERLRQKLITQAEALDITSGIKNVEAVYNECGIEIEEEVQIQLPPSQPMMEEPNYDPPEYQRIETKIKAVSNGGHFFLGLVKQELNRACNLDYTEPPFENDDHLMTDCDVLWYVCPRIEEKYAIKHHLMQGKKVIWHWIGSDILNLIDHYKGYGELPAIFTWRANQQYHLGVSSNLVDELKEMGLVDAEEMNLVSNWDYDPAPMPERFTVLVYYPPKGDPTHEYACIYGQDVVEKVVKQLPHIDFILYGMREGQTLDWEQPRNVKLEQFNKDEDYMRQLYEKGSVLLRYTMHDGYPSSLIEMCMRGGQVITSCKFPYTMHATSEDDIINLLEYIKDFKVINHRGSAYYKKMQTQEVFIRRFIAYVRGL